MQFELREFPQGMDLSDHAAGKAASDPTVQQRQARRSWILIDGRCVAHIGWAACDLVFIAPISDAEKGFVLAKCREEFDGDVDHQMASPSFAEPTDRRRKRKLNIPGHKEDDE